MSKFTDLSKKVDGLYREMKETGENLGLIQGDVKAIKGHLTEIKTVDSKTAECVQKYKNMAIICKSCSFIPGCSALSQVATALNVAVKPLQKFKTVTTKCVKMSDKPKKKVEQVHNSIGKVKKNINKSSTKVRDVGKKLNKIGSKSLPSGGQTVMASVGSTSSNLSSGNDEIKNVGSTLSTINSYLSPVGEVLKGIGNVIDCLQPINAAIDTIFAIPGLKPLVEGASEALDSILYWSGIQGLIDTCLEKLGINALVDSALSIINPWADYVKELSKWSTDSMNQLVNSFGSIKSLLSLDPTKILMDLEKLCK